MPLRYRPTLTAVSLVAVRQHHHVRPFHATLGRLQDDDGRNHYQILNVQPTASPAEIKKSFYTLSKSHHPDHNPADPAAPRRFMRISEAYSVLSHADKRAAYDRDVLRLHTHHSHHQHHHAPRGSYHSTGPAGGRAASGLSRRRGTFQGPPPSFYRSGGWGTHSAKRAAAHEESTGGGGGSSSSSGSGGEGGGGGGGTYGGMGPGQDPFGHRDDVPHFDRESHERTHRRGDERRAARRRARERSGGGSGADLGSVALFIIIGSALVFTIWVPIAVFGTRKDKKGREEKNKKIGQGK